MANTQDTNEIKSEIEQDLVEKPKHSRAPSRQSRQAAPASSPSTPAVVSSAGKKTPRAKTRKPDTDLAQANRASPAKKSKSETKPASAPVLTTTQENQNVIFALSDFGLSTTTENGSAILEHLEGLSQVESPLELIDYNTKFWVSFTSNTFDQTKTLTEIALSAAVNASQQTLRPENAI